MFTDSWDSETGPLQPRQVLPTTSPSETFNSYAGAIVATPDGSLVIVSNRSGANDESLPESPGDDSLALFAVLENGMLDPRGWAASGGHRPRFITMSTAGEIVTTLEHTGCIATLSITDGLIDPPFIVAQTGSPTCVVMSSVDGQGI